MNRVLSTAVFGALAACSSGGIGNDQAQAAPAGGGTETRLSVLGVNVDDSPTVVRDKMMKESFRVTTGKRDCLDMTSFDAVVKDAASHPGRVVDGVSCRADYVDGAGRSVTAYFQLLKRGPSLSGMEYFMPFSGTQADLNAMMRKRYGAPVGTTPTNGGPAPTFSTPTDQRENAYLRATVNNQRAYIQVEDRGFSKSAQSQRELRDAVSQATGGARVKL